MTPTIQETRAPGKGARTAPGRDSGIDIARAIGIILVLYGHALEMSFLGGPAPGDLTANSGFWQWRFIYSFHMPLFFMISGMVFRDRSTRDVLSNSLALLLIAYATHAAGWLAKVALGDSGATVQTLAFPFLNGYQFYTSLVWFLVALAFVQLFHHMMLRSRAAGRAGLAALLVACAAVAGTTGSNHFQIGSWLPGLLFHGIGYWLARSGLIGKGLIGKGGRFRPLLIAAALAGTAALAPLNGGCLFDPAGRCGHDALHGAFAVWMAFGRIGFVPAFLVTALLGGLAVLWIADAIAGRGGPVASALSRLGTMTLDLLILNGFVLHFVQPHLKPFVADASSPGAVAAWALALTGAQIALLPVSRRVTGPAVALARGAARWIVGKTPPRPVHP